MSQETQILIELKKGRPLTPMKALSKFGCFRLAARIHDLRAKGWDIKMRERKMKDKRFAEYYL
jgi:hypothetical protein